MVLFVDKSRFGELAQDSSAVMKSYAAQTQAQSLVGGANEAQTGTWRGNKYIKPRSFHEVIK